MTVRSWLLLLVPFAVAQGQQRPAGDDRVTLRPVVSGLAFPVYLTAPGADSRLFVVEKVGRIRIIKNGRLLSQPFLDISRLVSKENEQGLLGLAFHPRYGTNGIFVVDYTDLGGDVHVATFKVSADPDRADPLSEHFVLRIEKRFPNHNGGEVTFGPDGDLYVGVGDGGSYGDPTGRGQDPRDLLGSLLRVEIHDDGSLTVPKDNPYAEHPGYRTEIWDTGLRNPWRFSFDRDNGDLYIADVGEITLEEIDVSPSATGGGRGANYGWSMYEGSSCFSTTVPCNPRGMTMPTLEYPHSEGCAVIGGYVYRGAAMPTLQGTYFYADYCSGWIRSFQYVGGHPTDAREWKSLPPHGAITSFGEDAAGELYLVTQDGNVMKIVATP